MPHRQTAQLHPDAHRLVALINAHDQAEGNAADAEGKTSGFDRSALTAAAAWRGDTLYKGFEHLRQTLSPRDADAVLRLLTAAWLDGFAVGARAQEMCDRPAALDSFRIGANLPDEEAATAKARAAIAPLEKAIRAAKAQEHAELREATLRIAAEHLRTTLFAAVYEDAGQRAAEGVTRAADELLCLVGRTAAPVEKPEDGGIDRFPFSRAVRYIVRGAPEVPDEYNETRTIAPTEITFTYRETPDGQLGRVHAYVKGWWVQDGARVHSEAVGRHFHGDLASWPEWLAAEARLHDPAHADEEQRDERQAQANLDLLAEQICTLDGAMRIVESWFVDVNDGHGLDASDLVHQLHEAGYKLPSDGPS